MTVEYTATNISTKSLEFNNGQIKGVPKNPRTITQKDYEDLKNSIKQSGIYGFKAPIVFKNDDRYIVLGGNMRLKACKELNILEIPIFLLADDTPVEELMKIAIQDNISNGEWDWDLLANEWPQDQLEEWGLDTTQGWDTKKELPDDIDETPELPKTPVSKLGDLWLLGNHRVLCGDSTDKQTVERLMDGKKADMVFTDPPYGVAIGAKNVMLNSFQKAGRNLKPIENDALSEEDLFEVLKKAFINVKNISEDHMSFYVCSPQGGGLGMMMMMMMKDSGLPVRHTIIWVKNQPTFSMNRLDYDYQHEPILYGWNKKHEFYGGGDHKTSVWNVDKPREAKEHPTMKPIELMVNAIINSSKSGQIIVDIFLGSGSTLIAAEQTDRTCYGLELDPQYVDVICKRWQTLTGQLPILESTGEAHDFCS